MSEQIEDVVTVEDGAKCVEFTLASGKKIKLRELRGGEVRALQKIGEGLSSKTLSTDMAIASIVSIDGEKLSPVRNDIHLDDRSNRFSSKEYFEISLKYSKYFNEDEADPKFEQG